MSEAQHWVGPEQDGAKRFASAERQLELGDYIAGLEATLAQQSEATILTPSEQLAVERRLADLERSLAWRVGRRITTPIRVIRRVRRS